MTTTGHTRSTLFLALLAALNALSVAQAADVQLYGRLSTSLRMTNVEGGDTSVDMNNEGSRWGLNITETVSPDLSAKAYLEGGFNSDDGGFSNSGRSNLDTTLFDRHAVLALHSKTYGELGFGRSGSVRSAVAPYSLILLPLDPVNGAYYDIVSISVMFGADPRANNTVTYVSPRIRGWKTGISYSFATTDQELPDSRENNRLLSFGANYEGGPLGIYLGASYARNGESDAASADAGKKYAREDSQAYTIGMTYKPDETWKFYTALQYQSDYRNVAGWKLDRGAVADPLDRKHGIDGISAMVGFNYRMSNGLRGTMSYYYFEGDHTLADGTEESGKRQTVNAVLDYRLSKTFMLYGTVTYSKGGDVLDTADCSKWVSRIGAMKFF